VSRQEGDFRGWLVNIHRLHRIVFESRWVVVKDNRHIRSREARAIERQSDRYRKQKRTGCRC
jgi:hypothetical protein